MLALRLLLLLEGSQAVTHHTIGQQREPASGLSCALEDNLSSHPAWAMVPQITSDYVL